MLCCVGRLVTTDRRVVSRHPCHDSNGELGAIHGDRKSGDAELIHTDHGPQFTSWTFSQKVRSVGLIQSIGTVGDAFDNAVIESFWGSMQIELLNRKRWTTRLELSMAMVDWIEGFYNRRRRHSSIGNVSPIEFERRQSLQAA